MCSLHLAVISWTERPFHLKLRLILVIPPMKSHQAGIHRILMSPMNTIPGHKAALCTWRRIPWIILPHSWLCPIVKWCFSSWWMLCLCVCSQHMKCDKNKNENERKMDGNQRAARSKEQMMSESFWRLFTTQNMDVQLLPGCVWVEPQRSCTKHNCKRTGFSPLPWWFHTNPHKSQEICPHLL